MVHVVISGFVQGIGFRQFIKHNAGKLEINGWVKNLPDGRVEALFDGKDSSLKEMVDLCKKGPFLAKVRDLDVIWDYNNEEKFEEFEMR